MTICFQLAHNLTLEIQCSCLIEHSNNLQQPKADNEEENPVPYRF